MRIARVIFTNSPEPAVKNMYGTKIKAPPLVYEYFVPSDDDPKVGDLVVTHPMLGGMFYELAINKLLGGNARAGVAGADNNKNLNAKSIDDDEDKEDVEITESIDYADLDLEKYLKIRRDYVTQITSSIKKDSYSLDGIHRFAGEILKMMSIGLIVGLEERNFIETRANKTYVARIPFLQIQTLDEFSLEIAKKAIERDRVVSEIKGHLNKLKSDNSKLTQLVAALAPTHPELEALNTKLKIIVNSGDHKKT